MFQTKRSLAGHNRRQSLYADSDLELSNQLWRDLYLKSRLLARKKSDFQKSHKQGQGLGAKAMG
jgi:hypothetical protein